MDTLRLFATLLPLAVSSGINLYATILTAGLAIQFHWVEGTPPGLDILGSWPVIIIAAALFSLEVLADKIQFIDNLWDIVHTIIRPLGACFIGLAAMGKADPVVVIIATMFVGSIALVSHSGKAGARIAINLMSPHENLTNVIISTIEDIGASLLTYISLQHPFEALGIAILFLALIILIVPNMLRWAWFILTGFFIWIKSLGHSLLKKEIQPDLMPAEHLVLLYPNQPIITGKCKAQNIKGGNGRTGYLALLDNHLVFTFNSWSGIHKWQISLDQIIAISNQKGWFMDTLVVFYVIENQRRQKAVFVFLKDHASIAKKFAESIKPGIPR